MRAEDTPVYITVFNNLDRGLRQLVAWLQSADINNITVIDNDSTWEPLLRFYDESNIQVIRANENLGHDAFWKLGMHNQINTRFIVTDPDVVPDPACPLDLIGKMHDVADRFSPAKVGPGLRIDNLPDHYRDKHRVVGWESQFWANKTADGDGYCSPIDSTLALYQPHSPLWPSGQHIRLAEPYILNHLPWYEDSDNLSEECLYYKANVKIGICNW